MSLPSDNENSKKVEKSLSDYDSSSDESKDPTQKRKKKQRQMKAAGAVDDTITSPGTSNTSKTAKNETEPEESKPKAEDSDQEDEVEVRDDIEQLHLDEHKPKDPETKNLQPTEQVENCPGILRSQPYIAASSTTTNNETVQTPPVHTLQVNRLYNILKDEPDTQSLHQYPLSAVGLESEGNVPPNTLHETESSEEYSSEQGLPLLPSSSNVLLKRTAFAKKAEDTLDDVSEITTDISELNTDSTSLSKESATKQGPSRDEMSESSVSEYKTVKSVLQEPNENADILPEENIELDECSRQEMEISEYRTADEEANDSQCSSNQEVSDLQSNVCSSKSSAEGQPSISWSDLSKKSNVDDEDSNKSIKDSKMHVSNEKAEGMDKQEDDHAHGSEIKDGSSEEQVGEIEEAPDHQGSSEEHVIGENIDEPEDEQEDLEARAEAIEQVDDEDASGDQDMSEQDNSSNLENFADGEFVRFHVDSSITTSTSDSGIENSEAVFIRNDRPNAFEQHEVAAAFQDNSETTSSLAVSGLAGLNNLQQWIGAGARVDAPEPIPEVVSSDPSAQMSDEVVDQPVPSSSSDNSQQDWPGRGVVYLARQDLLNEPMECAENFDSDEVPQKTLPKNLESNILNIKVESRSSGDLSQRRISTGGDVENGNVAKEKSNVAKEKSKKHAKSGLLKSLDPKTTMRLAGDDFDQRSSSSMERSADSSLADMDDAIESSDSRSKEEGTEQVSTHDNPLIVLPKSSTKASAKHRVDKKPSPKKRRAKVSAEPKSKTKKRKDLNVSCRHQAIGNVDLQGMQSSDSDEEAKV